MIRFRMILPLLGTAVLLTGSLRGAEVIVEPSLTYQTLVGYGQGSMDQANVPWFTSLSVGERERLLDLLYTLDDRGLGLNICRTYICAGDAPGHAHMGRRPGGSASPLGYEPEDGVFRWAGHEASLWHARGARQRGALMVAFCNSPPWWMTVSGCTSGAAGGTNNLRFGLEGRFAIYMCDVLKHYRDEWGIDFDRISPINEPEALWWKEGGGQDGCHVEAEQAGPIIAALHARLREYGLSARIQAPECAFSKSLDYLDQILADGDAYQAVAELTCHQYITDFHSLRRWPLRSRLHGKPLWMSEWGDWTNQGIDLALNYARKLHEAHRLMQAVAWCMWEPSFLLGVREGRVEPNVAFHAVAQFTRFARPGMTAIEASDTTLKTACYIDQGSHKLVVVTVNDTDREVRLTYDLTGFEGLGDIEHWRTSATEDLARLEALPGESRLSTRLPAQSVTTFVTEYQRIVPPLIANGGFETGRLDGWTGEPPELTGVQDNYPQGGSYDGYIDLTPGESGSLSQRVTGLQPGDRYVLTAACATSDIEATLSVEGEGVAERVAVSGGAYQHARAEFTAPASGAITVAYRAGPDEGERPWATIDNVRLSPFSAK